MFAASAASSIRFSTVFFVRACLVSFWALGSRVGVVQAIDFDHLGPPAAHIVLAGHALGHAGRRGAQDRRVGALAGSARRE